MFLPGAYPVFIHGILPTKIRVVRTGRAHPGKGAHEAGIAACTAYNLLDLTCCEFINIFRITEKLSAQSLDVIFASRYIDAYVAWKNNQPIKHPGKKHLI